MRKFILMFFVVFSVNSFSQTKNELTTAVTKTVTADFIGFRNTPSIDLEWLATVQPLASKNESEEQALLEKIKKAKNELKKQQYNSKTISKSASTSCPSPTMGINFQGINNNGNNWPLDNTIATSIYSPYMVTCVNSMIQYYDYTSGNLNYSQTLYNFINPSPGALITNLCDPKVIFDSQSNRFIFYCQTCDGISANSKIIIGVSVNGNPSSGWYFYSLSGNPLNDGSWFDYPKMAVTTNEIFVTGNLFDNNGTFNQAVVYQINKNQAYAGIPPNSQSWSAISGNPSTLLPLGTTRIYNNGPDIYLLSTIGVTNGSNVINLYRITDQISASNEIMTRTSLTMPLNYSSPADATQPGISKLLSTGDCRAQSGYIKDGIAHLVFQGDDGSNYTNIFYTRIDIANNTVTASKFGSFGVDYCYPAIAPAIDSLSNISSTIVFSSSSYSTFPQINAVNCDDNFQWSNPTTIKQGLGAIYYPSNTNSVERWGDYSGIHFNYSSGRIWVSGDYALSNGRWGQWIAELYNDQTIGIQEKNQEKIESKIYPNPVVDLMSIEFTTIKEYANIKIEIVDLSGKIIKELYNNSISKGKNILTFNKLQLTTGIYFIKIYNQDKTFKNEKIIIN